MVNEGTTPAEKPKKIAVFTNGWSFEFLSFALEGIRREAEKDGADLFVYVSYHLPTGVNSHARNQMQLLGLFKPEQYDGIIVLANTLNTPEEKNTIQSMIKKSGLPAVSTEVRMPGTAFIGTSNYQGAYQLARHMVEEHQAKRIVFVSGYQGNEESAIRKGALEDVLSEHNLTLMDTIYGNFDYYRTTLEIAKWVDDERPLPDAFICANDHMALGVISTLHRYGIEVPRDVLVTGFDHIRDAQFNYPSVATVSMCWEELGVGAYQELKEQMVSPDPARERIFDSRFIPSESCGCEPEPDTVELRLERMRNNYSNNNDTNMVDFFFQEIRVAMAQAENKEQVHTIAGQTLGRRHFLGDNYCICTEPLFFELEDAAYQKETRKFHARMDVLYESKNGKTGRLREFDSSDVYPGYKKTEDRSSFYIFSPMFCNNMIIGYLAIRDYPEILYNMRFKRWINNIESLLITVRQYIFSQKANRQLRSIYMQDFLTGMYNRTGCENVLYSFIESQKASGKHSMLLFADINFMKVINDEYGHLNGDLAIKATATALRDSLPDGWLFGRYGGDEFIAVGEDDGSCSLESCREQFAKSMERIARRLKVNFRLSASLGAYSITPTDMGSISDYIRMADESMYEEKQRIHEEYSRI